MVITNESSDSPSTCSGVHLDLFLPKPPDRPSVGMGSLVESCIPFCSDTTWSVPILSVSLDNEIGRFEYEVWLEPPEHRLMHLKLQSSFLELIAQETFNQCVFLWQNLPQAGLAVSLPCSGGNGRSPTCSLTQFLSRFRGSLTTKTVLVAEFCLPHLLPRLRRSFINPFRHFMFNFNIESKQQQARLIP